MSQPILLKSLRLSFDTDRKETLSLESNIFDLNEPRVTKSKAAIFNGSNAVDAIYTTFCPASFGMRAFVAHCVIPSANKHVERKALFSLQDSILEQAERFLSNNPERQSSIDSLKKQLNEMREMTANKLN